MFKQEAILEKRGLLFLLVFLFTLVGVTLTLFLKVLFFAAIMAIFLYPLKKWFENKPLFKPGVASALTVVVFILLVVLPVTSFSSIVVTQLYKWTSTLNPQDGLELYQTLQHKSWYINGVLPIYEKVISFFGLQGRFTEMLIMLGRESAGFLYKYSPGVFLETASFFFYFVFSLVSLFILLLNGEHLLNLIGQTLPIRYSHGREWITRIGDTVAASLLGYLLTGVVQGALGAGLYAIAGLNDWLLLGLLTFFMSLVPILGAAGIWLPVGIWQLMQSNMTGGLLVMGGGALLISSIDNIIKPLIIEGKTKLSPLLVFMAILGGIKTFGPLGLLFGPILVALFVTVWQQYREA